MAKGYRLLVIGFCSLFVWTARAEQKWTTHFAYNNVTQIAMSSDKVYAISDGSLFSVEKQSEKIAVYNRQSGLSGTGITCIHYDATGKQLIIGYGTGKIDILTAQGVRYIGEMYDKDMTQRKTIHNVTIAGRTAYLSTAFGVQTMDLRENKLVDSYWLRPGGQETDVQDVLLANDSIYAFTTDSLFAASMRDNIVDYTVWKREKRSERIQPDIEKGKHYQDETSHWYASNAEGIVRFTQTARLSYKPDGPMVNSPYRIFTQGGKVYVVQGGRWDVQYNKAGCVMRYDGTRWNNISLEAIRSVTNRSALDFMQVAIDPQDVNHFYVASYGTGLYEFMGDSLVRADIAGGENSLTAIVPDQPTSYTRLDYVQYDERGNLWMLDAALEGQLQCKAADGTWHGLTVVADNQNLALHTPGGLVIDRIRPNYKWLCTARYNRFVCLMDDQGTAFDTSDDRTITRSEWTDQHGHTFRPTTIYGLMQDRTGRLWIATEIGMGAIEVNTDFFAEDAILLPEVTDINGENPLTTQRINAICQSPDGHLWIGTELGVYEMNEEMTEILAHFTTDNSAMPDNAIMALAAGEDGHIWFGTSEGLVEYNPQGIDEGLKNDELMNDDASLNEGSMLRWRLHLSYSNPEEIAATPNAVFAAANGALFSVDKADDQLSYWSKATGLNGSSVAHIAYDEGAERLIIAYENGQIDLLDQEGHVTQMPDISMKAGSIAVTINAICVGSKYSYLAMPFGIIAIQVRKGEVTDTYYIGNEAASIEVQEVVEMNDSLFAFSFDRMYKASLANNLVDYNYWASEAIPFEQVQQAETHQGQLYVLAHDSLYRRAGTSWQLVSGQPLKWMHVSDGQMLVYVKNQGLFRLQDDDTLSGLTSTYVATDAVYTNGVYWIAEESQGLVRLGANGDDRFQPEGPLSNFGYHLDVAHDRLYVSPGGRWSEQYGRQSSLSIYDGQQWTGIPWPDTWYFTNHDIRDAVQFAVDATDPEHFFVATYGTGVFEFKNNRAVTHYDSSNSTLRKTGNSASDYYFTRTDGAMTDEQGNLWVMNATEIGQPLHIRTAAGQWIGLRLRSGGTDLEFTTPTGIWVDQRNSNRKWMMDQRATPRLILLDDNGTPTMSSDDRCMARSSFTDQNGNVLTPNHFRCFAQDHTNRIWIGTDKGLLLIPKEVDFFSSSACKRIIIPRNDGTGLGDYLLGDEQINCLAVDGGNRMWIGTANSGLYLIEDDTITIAHFTETNSLLPSNGVQSIAIMPKTGEVFVGTDKGIASYRSDASEAQETMSNAYAFPNPVRPDYGGMISISGLMDNTVVNIVDAGGNLVCKTRSHGGTAVWDGKLPDGRRATPGVYTALCNAEGGHTIVKILVAY